MGKWFPEMFSTVHQMARTHREFKTFGPEPYDLRVASGTDWERAGITGAFVTAMVIQETD
jgi:hypothetical protein